MYDLHFEQFVQEPEANLSQLIQWLDLPEPKRYLQDCASIVFSKPREPRHNTTWWTEERIMEITSECSHIPFLKAYRFA